MNKDSVFINLSINSAIKLIKEKIEGRFITCKMVDKYKQSINEKVIYVIILEKYFIRVGNRVTVTIVIDDFDDKTRIHLKAAGGSDSNIMRFDWGAANKFENEVYTIFEKHIIK